MKARKPRVTGFYIETWKANVWLVWPCNSAQLIKIVKKQLGRKVEMEDDEWAGRCLDIPCRRGRVRLIAMREFRMTPDSISTLAHECFHAAEFILENKVKHDSALTSEVYAYLTDSILRRCLRIMTGRKDHLS